MIDTSELYLRVIWILREETIGNNSSKYDAVQYICNMGYRYFWKQERTYSIAAQCITGKDINEDLQRALDSFHHRVAWRLTGRQPRRRWGGSWACLTLEKAMGAAGFEGIRKSVTRRHNTFTQYIATRPIMDLCERSTRRPGTRVSRRWWYQAGIKLEGEKKRAAEAATVLKLDPD